MTNRLGVCFSEGCLAFSNFVKWLPDEVECPRHRHRKYGLVFDEILMMINSLGFSFVRPEVKRGVELLDELRYHCFRVNRLVQAFYIFFNKNFFLTSSVSFHLSADCPHLGYFFSFSVGHGLDGWVCGARINQK